MKRVVSVSLGSSSRDKSIEATFLGEQFRVERIGTNGSLSKAAAMIRELDGQVACIGLGGMDRYLWLGKKRYAMRQVDRLARIAVRTPVVDGSGLKHTLEPKLLLSLVKDGTLSFDDKQVLMLSGVDRWGMAEVIAKMNCKVVYGDLIFALGIPFPMRSLTALRILGGTLLPIICWLPMSFIYPTGEKQHRPPSAKKQAWFRSSDIIVGDYLYLRRYLPENLTDKIIITNTTTAEDMQLLAARQAKMLVTTTPRFEGRSFGTNVMEGVLVALSGRRPEELTEADYLDFISRLEWKPSVEYFSSLDQSAFAPAENKEK